MSELATCRLGLIEYRAALALQESLRARRQAEEIPDTLLLLEHPPVYTRGRRSAPEDLPVVDRGIEVVPVDRGGKLTYHGPGQLVGYPIVRIADVVAYIRTLERAIVAALSDVGVEAGVRDGLTGVWTTQGKIGSIGLHVSRGVTTHGFAVNVDCDLDPFSWIVPCGLPDAQMTSVARCGGDADLKLLADRVAEHLAAELGVRPTAMEPGEPTLGLRAAATEPGEPTVGVRATAVEPGEPTVGARA